MGEQKTKGQALRAWIVSPNEDTLQIVVKLYDAKEVDYEFMIDSIMCAEPANFALLMMHMITEGLVKPSELRQIREQWQSARIILNLA